MNLKNFDYYKNYIGKKIKITFNNHGKSSKMNRYFIGNLKKVHCSDDIVPIYTFIISPKMCLSPPNGIYNEEYEIENVYYTDQDQIFEGFYWSNMCTHCVTSDMIEKIELVLTFEEEIKNWKLLGNNVIENFIDIDIPLFDLVNSYFEGVLYVEI